MSAALPPRGGWVVPGIQAVELPVYDVQSSKRGAATKTFFPSDIILFEGILVLFFPRVRELLDMRLFVDLDSDTRLARRVTRDLALGRDLNAILAQYGGPAGPWGGHSLLAG